ncbi:MAG: pyridoxal-phosphate dependent enzyme [Campylobacterales bacterium]|nr:pyridoxal-phosphate dependent enzyme [Campylobacterales bacterium]
MQNSSISKITLEGREFFVKRDDLFDPYLSGNKFRKLHSLIQIPKHTFHTIISYGGSQSNAMLAIAALAKQKGWHFIYYTKPLSQSQKETSLGNYADACLLGMEHKELDDELYKDYIASLEIFNEKGVCVVHQGGADRLAQEGLENLAQEIRLQIQEESAYDFTAVATPSGTGTTALFLAQALPELKVYTTPCVGSVSYLKEQMSALADIPSNLIILENPQKYHFAKPYREFYTIYKKLLESGIEFDLLYAPAMWLTLLAQPEEKILYIHSGGVSGNSSMKERYKRKFSDVTF